jgi:hypothetical protein
MLNRYTISRREPSSSPAVAREADDGDGAAGKTNEKVNISDGNSQQSEQRLDRVGAGGLNTVAALDRSSVAL